QESGVVPLGDRRPRRIDVRVISATNRDLTADVARGTFRQDLFYRLAAFPIRLPPLRERREDVALLTDRFLAEAAERHHKAISGLAPAALDLLAGFGWPGNIRELQNEIERAVALAAAGEAIGPQHLSAKLGAVAAPAGTAPAESGSDLMPLRAARTAFEARHIAAVLRRHAGNVTR